MSKSLIAIVPNRLEAEAQIEKLKEIGLVSGEISFLMPDTSARKDFGLEKSSKAPEGAVAGGSAGALLGGALGWLAGIGSIVLPGAGTFIIAGPIIMALSGAAVGGTLLGVAGALAGMGIPEYEAKIFEGKVKEGKILLGVHTDNKELLKKSEEILRKAQNIEVSVVNETPVTS